MQIFEKLYENFQWRNFNNLYEAYFLRGGSTKCGGVWVKGHDTTKCTLTLLISLALSLWGAHIKKNVIFHGGTRVVVVIWSYRCNNATCLCHTQTLKWKLTNLENHREWEIESRNKWKIITNYVAEWRRTRENIGVCERERETLINFDRMNGRERL